jgi:hypothetical protein
MFGTKDSKKRFSIVRHSGNGAHLRTTYASAASINEILEEVFNDNINSISYTGFIVIKELIHLNKFE